MSVLEIDLNAIKQNLEDAKKLLNHNQKICFVVKANAYGFGAKKIVKFFCEDVDCFAVSSEKEFFQVCKVTNKAILILDPIYENITKLAKNGAEFSVPNKTCFDKIFSVAKANNNVKFKIHLKLNTGMNRFGFNELKDVFDVIKKSQKLQNIQICGVFSHYFDAKCENFAKNQNEKFLNFVGLMNEKTNLKNVTKHICATDGLVCFNGFDMVRLGMFLYSDARHSTLTLKSKILDFHILDKGDTAGYGAIFKANKKTKLATVGIGYGDGLFRNIVKKGYVLINGKAAKIVAVCMDSILVDATNIDSKIGDDVVLIGKSENAQIFICDVASWCDTIDYEIITHLSQRIKRKYIRWFYANYNRKI